MALQISMFEIAHIYSDTMAPEFPTTLITIITFEIPNQVWPQGASLRAFAYLVSKTSPHGHLIQGFLVKSVRTSPTSYASATEEADELLDRDHYELCDIDGEEEYIIV